MKFIIAMSYLLIESGAYEHLIGRIKMLSEQVSALANKVKKNENAE